MPPAAKNDPKDAKETPPPAEASAPAAASGFKALLPLIAAVVLAPALTYAVAEFVLVPRLRTKLSAPVEAAPEKKPEAPRAAGGHGGKAEPLDPGTFEYKDVVVNLAGTMGTRYLKTSFVVTGKGVRSLFETEKARMADATLSLLSAVSLADLEQAGAKNVLRGKLVNAYNQALGKHVVDQVYFSDFVIQ